MGHGTKTQRSRTIRRRSLIREERAQSLSAAKFLMLGLFGLLERVVGFLVAFAALVLVAFGVFRQPSGADTSQLLALLGLSALLVVRLLSRLSTQQASRRQGADLELGTLFVASTFVLVEMAGGPDSLLYPLVYALVAFLVAFHGPLSASYFVGIILGTEAATVALSEGAGDWRLFASHASFNLLFGLLYALFLRSEIVQRRRTMQSEIKDHLSTIRGEARDFRLTSAMGFESRELSLAEMVERRSTSSVEAIHDALYNLLAVAERALNPHTVALYWLSQDGSQFVLKELRSFADNINDRPLASQEGFLGAIVKRREPLVLTKLRAGHAGMPYYQNTHAVTDFAGVPIFDGEHLRGVLLCDRTNGEPFESADVDVLTTLAGETVRAVQVERIFSEMDREKYRKERFYQASQAFNSALTIEDVAKVAVSAARRVVQAEFGALVVLDGDDATLTFADHAHEDVSAWLGHSIDLDEGLVGAALRSNCALPHGSSRTSRQPLLDIAHPITLPGAKVMPLAWNGRAVGVLVLGSSNDAFLPLELYDMARVVSDHAAIAIANAQMYERMKHMATTDGLTGLVNHRRFQETFSEFLARAERFNRPLSVILTDIDHFKSVNDTYGHPVGDKVLKAISKVLQENARRIDVVARYGGEEFAVLMEETGSELAMQIAERMRAAVEREVFKSEHGEFRCTLSLGVSTYGAHGKTKADLTEKADQALYRAKHQGRNRVVLYGPENTNRREAS